MVMNKDETKPVITFFGNECVKVDDKHMTTQQYTQAILGHSIHTVQQPDKEKE